VLEGLIKAEVAEREVRSVNYQMKVARFPAHRDLAGFDFKESAVNEALVRTLHRGEFLEEAENIVLIGGRGTGKTHLSTAIGIQAIVHHHRRVRFLSTIELVNALEQENSRANRDSWPTGSSTPTSSFWTNWGICHLARPVAHCCFTCSASSTSAPASSSPPT